MPSIKIEIEQEISNSDINDLMVTALEGGVDWCYFYVIRQNKDDFKDVHITEILTSGGSLKVIDSETDEEHILTLDMVLKGIKMECEGSKQSFEEMFDNHDAYTADNIIQYAIFGELIYC